MNLKQRGYGDVCWIYLAQDRDQWQTLKIIKNVQVL
jgi:hypothetical protein